jgi:hypothetical protein
MLRRRNRDTEDDRDLVDEVEDDEAEDELLDADEIEIVDEGTPGIVGLLAGLVIGAFVGAGVALLLAPERGDVTRRRIRTKFSDVTDEARDQFEGWRDQAERELRRRQRKVRRRLRKGA